MRDVATACDLLRPVWDRTQGGDGYVSIEVDPNLADDTAATIAQATHFHEAIARPNLMVKIPATDAGVPAIEEMTARGYAINVTLIFSLTRHRQVAEAYLRGLERLVASGGDPSRIHSVASFFVSRVDTETDRRLAGRSGRPQGSAWHRQRKARLPAVQGAVPRRALGRSCRARRDRAALPLGIHFGQGSKPARHALRRGADRPGDDLDHARGDDSRLSGPWPGRGAARGRSRRGPASVRQALTPPASTTTTSSRRSSVRGSRSSSRQSTGCSNRFARSAATSELVGSATRGLRPCLGAPSGNRRSRDWRQSRCGASVLLSGRAA